MNEENVNYFFNLDDFSHRDLFEGLSSVWEAIPAISSYLAQHALGKIEVSIPSSAILVHPELIAVGKGSIIDPGVYIEGPCIIGRECHIRFGSYLRGKIITGDHCVIGHGSEVKHSIFLNNARAAHLNYVGDSILGNDVHIGAGVKCANFRFDRNEISVSRGGGRRKTGLKKLGAILGDGVKIGCNSVTSPGTMLGKKVICYPCINVKGFVLSETVVAS